MTITKLIKANLGLVLMAVVLLSAVACKKDKAKPEPKLALHGEWQELGLSAGLERNLYFSSDNGFKMDVIDRISPSNVINTYTGSYTLVNDSVKVKITKKQTIKDNMLVSSEVVDNDLFEKGTYQVEGNVLTLKYITYPADAPAKTEIKYRRRLID